MKSTANKALHVSILFSDILISERNFDLDELKDLLNAMLYCSDRQSMIVSDAQTDEKLTVIKLFSIKLLSDGSIVQGFECIGQKL